MSIELTKKALAAGLAAAMLTVPACAETLNFFNDGYVAIKDSSKFLRSGDVLTATVVEKGAEWESFDKLSSIQKDKIEFYGIASANSDGSFSIEFSPDDNGEYTVYVGSQMFDEPRKYEIRYINKTGFEAAAELLRSAQTNEELEETLSSYKTELGLFSSVFEAVNLKEVGELSKEAVSKIGTDKPLEIIAVLEKAALIVKLNSGEISDLGELSDIAGISDIKYFGKDISEDVTDALSEKAIESLEEFDKLLADGVILANVNNKSAAVVKEVLKEYHTSLGISQSKITDELCNKIVKQGDFEATDELISYIKAYKGVSSGAAGGSGGSGGGSGGGGFGGGSASSTAGGALYAEETEVNENIFRLPFNDLQGYEWAEESIKNLWLKAVINGKAENLFCPAESVTREEFVKMIALAFKMKLVDGDMSFADVSEDEWYAPYVRTAYNARIVYGYNEKEFGIGQSITREDLCVMVCRALYAGDLALAAEENEPVEFEDGEEISDYARDAVNTLSRAGIVNGFDGKFRPGESATRAEAARIIYLVTKYAGL